ncbi:MAG: Trp family transcriptional regulator [Elusimicrobiota bacterium]|jgi:TrpR family trp operon transcriptional repressor
MNRNTEAREAEAGCGFLGALVSIKSEARMGRFLKEILTPDELRSVMLRWRLIQMLNSGHSQRDIARRLRISLCKITRGSRILKNRRSVTAAMIRRPLQ